MLPSLSGQNVVVGGMETSPRMSIESPSAPSSRGFEGWRFRWPRSRRARWGLVGALLVVALLGGPALWRAWLLRGLPDAGDPFDVQEMLRPVEVPNGENAFFCFQEAHTRLGR